MKTTPTKTPAPPPTVVEEKKGGRPRSSRPPGERYHRAYVYLPVEAWGGDRLLDLARERGHASISGYLAALLAADAAAAARKKAKAT